PRDPNSGELRGPISRRVRAGQDQRAILRGALPSRRPQQAGAAHRAVVPDSGRGRAWPGESLQERDPRVPAAQRRSTFPPETITPTRKARASSFFSSKAQAASAPVGSTSIFIRSQRKNIARKSS